MQKVTQEHNRGYVGMKGAARIKAIIITVVLIGVIVVVAFVANTFVQGHRANKQAINNTIHSLGKIQAATQVGVNYRNYGTLLIDAQYSINQLDQLGLKGKQAIEIHKAFQNYTDAETIWDHEIHADVGTYCTLVDVSMHMHEKYQTNQFLLPTCKQGIQLAWAQADQHLKEASKE